MEVPPSSPFQVVARRARVPLSDLALHVAEQRRAVLRHLLFWFQDQTYFRQRWHRCLDAACVFEASGLVQIQRLLIEVGDALEQFPYGFAPTEGHDAQRLRNRLRMLEYELTHLQKLCGAYVSRCA